MLRPETSTPPAARPGAARPDVPTTPRLETAAPPAARPAPPQTQDLRVHQRHLHEQLFAAHAEAIEGPHPHQVDDDLDAHPRAPAEVGQRAVGPAALGRAFGDDRRAGRVAHLLDVGEPDPQGPAVALDGKAVHARVDVDRQHLEPPAARVVEHHPRRVEAHRLVVHEAAEEFGRVVRLEPGARVAHDGKAGGVGLVEAVGGEAAQLAEGLFGGVARHAARHRLLDEAAADLVHLFE